MKRIFKKKERKWPENCMLAEQVAQVSSIEIPAGAVTCQSPLSIFQCLMLKADHLFYPYFASMLVISNSYQRVGKEKE
jgi:hypothetical protein